MRALACVVLALATFAACAEDAAKPHDVDSDGIWVALHVQTGQGQDEYFAQLTVAEIARLRDGQAAGHPFVLARRVCSLDDEGHLQEYADDDRGGDVWFRADDVRRVVPLKRDPHVGDRDQSDKDDAEAKAPPGQARPTLPKF